MAKKKDPGLRTLRFEARINPEEEALIRSMARQLGISQADMFRMAIVEFCSARGLVIK